MLRLKKIAAISLCGLLLFSWFGYQIARSVVEHAINKALEARIDLQQYDEDELLEVKIPFPLPYQVNWTSFERYDGEIEYRGVHYKYVKRKLYNDTLIVLCLPNGGKTNLRQACDDFFKLVYDVDDNASTENSSKKSAKSPLFEYYSLTNDWDCRLFIPNRVLRSFFQFNPLNGNLAKTEHPPELWA